VTRQKRDWKTGKKPQGAWVGRMEDIRGGEGWAVFRKNREKNIKEQQQTNKRGNCIKKKGYSESLQKRKQPYPDEAKERKKSPDTALFGGKKKIPD